MNNRIRIAPFDAAYLESFEVREHEAALMDHRYLADLGESSQCVFFMLKDLPIAMVGYFWEWPGVIYVFIIPTIHTTKSSLHFVRLVKKYLQWLFDGLPSIHRMHTDSLADDDTDRWMRILGFQCEGTRVKYTTDQQDYRMWARVRE